MTEQGQPSWWGEIGQEEAEAARELAPVPVRPKEEEVALEAALPLPDEPGNDEDEQPPAEIGFRPNDEDEPQRENREVTDLLGEADERQLLYRTGLPPSDPDHLDPDEAQARFAELRARTQASERRETTPTALPRLTHEDYGPSAVEYAASTGQAADFESMMRRVEAGEMTMEDLDVAMRSKVTQQPPEYIRRPTPPPMRRGPQS